MPAFSCTEITAFGAIDEPLAVLNFENNFMEKDGTRMTRIERIKTDQISENLLNPRHPRAIFLI